MFPRMKNGILASINSFLSFKIRFDPTVARISFLVLGSASGQNHDFKLVAKRLDADVGTFFKGS